MEVINKNIIFAEEDIIAHGCNCQGKMNSGVAKAIRARWPAVYIQYKDRYDQIGLQLGIAQIIYINIDAPKFVANCMTQEYYGYDAKSYASLPAIKSSLTQVAEYAERYNYSVALPPIGCGLGGLNWIDVGPEVASIFESRKIKYRIYDLSAEKWNK